MYRRHGLLLLGLLLVALALPVSANGSSPWGAFNIFSGIRQLSANVQRSASEFVGNAQKTASNAANALVRFALVRSTNEEICFRILGCLSLKFPWVSMARPLPTPASPQTINVQYFLHTRLTPERYTVKSTPPLELAGSSFDPEKPTFFLVHGFLNGGDETWLSAMKDAILKKVDGNVFIVDWGGGAMDHNYLQVASNTRVVGRELAWFGRTLIEEQGADPQKFHYIGHSLGSHISGYAAKNITNVARITALDPAGPGFEDQPIMVRLHRDAADFIDVLHTNAKPLTVLGFGMMEPIGHMDIYVNGGVNQPGCETPDVKVTSNIWDMFQNPFTTVKDLVGCSHNRAYIYYTEAIDSSCIMWAHQADVEAERAWWKRGVARSVPSVNGPCEDSKCVAVGLDAPKYPARGHFTLVTGSSEPFCLAEHSNDGQTLESGELELL